MVLQLPSKLIPRQADVRETSNIGLTPEITSFSNSQHNHSNATGGGFVTDSTIDHDQTTNTHNLSTDIDHAGLTNTHNLTTDIDHDALLNFASNEHFTEASIDHTNILNIGTNTHAQIDSHLAGTDQTEVRAFFDATSDATFQTAYTVTTDKTFFLTDIIFYHTDPVNLGSLAKLGISGSPILTVYHEGAGGAAIHLSLLTPLKFTTAQVIQYFGQNGAPQSGVTLIGFEK